MIPQATVLYSQHTVRCRCAEANKIVFCQSAFSKMLRNPVRANVGAKGLYWTLELGLLLCAFILFRSFPKVSLTENLIRLI